ncbi:hypothetical protein IWQ49_000046 [Labrenzia sp. EL_126]|nr:hypothetical protein [Labrenzia sp. EL_126]
MREGMKPIHWILLGFFGTLSLFLTITSLDTVCSPSELEATGETWRVCAREWIAALGSVFGGTIGALVALIVGWRTLKPLIAQRQDDERKERMSRSREIAEVAGDVEKLSREIQNFETSSLISEVDSYFSDRYERGDVGDYKIELTNLVNKTEELKHIIRRIHILPDTQPELSETKSDYEADISLLGSFATGLSNALDNTTETSPTIVLFEIKHVRLRLSRSKVNKQVFLRSLWKEKERLDTLVLN